MSAKVKAKGHTAKHVTSRKHVATGKHHPSKSKTAATAKGTGAKVTTKARHPHHAKAVGFAIGDLLPVCGFEAVAMSARLAGARVDDDDVAELWELCGAAEATTIEDALAAAARFGLAACHPGEFAALVPADGVIFADQVAAGHDAFRDGAGHGADVAVGDENPTGSLVHGLILSIDVPGPHAVLATRDGWWSWGELHDPWPCRIEEAWAVSWS